MGDFHHRVLQPVSNIGNMPPVAAGMALASRQRGEDLVVLTWIGDGSVNVGATHETLNFAAVQKLPVVFIIQNNQVALGTRVGAHRLTEDFADFHRAYGCAGGSFDGNNVLDAYGATALAAARCRAGDGPVILDATTFRMGGHATHDEQEARHVLAAEQFAYWGARDPIGLFEEWLKGRGVPEARLAEIEEAVGGEVDRGADEALESRTTATPRGETAIEDVYARD